MSAPWYRVPGGTLPAIAGSVWLAAGGNVARIGALAWRGLGRTGVGSPLLALAVFGLFGAMFGPRAGEIYGRRVQKNCAVNIVDCTGGTFSPVQIAREYCEGV